mmetsp:Transcript_17487/g.26472  ORF Transcript_17487/g.26472 Transcript_17487/m.26472 type:complete len:233 (+) Transcript_17487:379-1077(+)
MIHIPRITLRNITIVLAAAVPKSRKRAAVAAKRVARRAVKKGHRHPIQHHITIQSQLPIQHRTTIIPSDPLPARQRDHRSLLHPHPFRPMALPMILPPHLPPLPVPNQPAPSPPLSPRPARNHRPLLPRHQFRPSRSRQPWYLPRVQLPLRIRRHPQRHPKFLLYHCCPPKCHLPLNRRNFRPRVLEKIAIGLLDRYNREVNEHVFSAISRGGGVYFAVSTGIQKRTKMHYI